MKTEIQETKLYKDFKKVLNIVDHSVNDNPYIIDCCNIAEAYHKAELEKAGKDFPDDISIRRKASDYYWENSNKTSIDSFADGGRCMKQAASLIIAKERDKYEELYKDVQLYIVQKHFLLKLLEQKDKEIEELKQKAQEDAVAFAKWISDNRYYPLTMAERYAKYKQEAK